MTNRPHRPARRSVVRFALPLIAAAVLPLVITATAAAVEAQTLVSFDRAAGQTPESVAVVSDGTAYVSLSFASEIYRITPAGQQSTLDIPTAGGITVGLAIDSRDTNFLYVAVRSADPAAAGVWRIPRDRFDDPARVVPLPTDSFPNGMTFDERSNLYIADSDLGRIWRVAPGAAKATVWAAGALLAPTGERLPGFRATRRERSQGARQDALCIQHGRPDHPHHSHRRRWQRRTHDGPIPRRRGR